MLGNKFFFILLFSFFIFSQAKFMKKRSRLPTETTSLISDEHRYYQNIQQETEDLNKKLMHFKNFLGTKRLANKKKRNRTWLHMIPIHSRHIFAVSSNSDLVSKLVENFIQLKINRIILATELTINATEIECTINKGIIEYVNRKDTDGNTPLHLAAKFNNKKVVTTLLTYGANSSAFNNNKKAPADLTTIRKIYTLLTKGKKTKKRKGGYTILSDE